MAATSAAYAAAPAIDSARLLRFVEQAGTFPRLHALIVARDGKPIVSASFMVQRSMRLSTSNRRPRK